MGEFPRYNRIGNRRLPRRADLGGPAYVATHRSSRGTPILPWECRRRREPARHTMLYLYSPILEIAMRIDSSFRARQTGLDTGRVGLLRGGQ